MSDSPNEKLVPLRIALVLMGWFVPVLAICISLIYLEMSWIPSGWVGPTADRPGTDALAVCSISIAGLCLASAWTTRPGAVIGSAVIAFAPLLLMVSGILFMTFIIMPPDPPARIARSPFWYNLLCRGLLAAPASIWLVGRAWTSRSRLVAYGARSDARG